MARKMRRADSAEVSQVIAMARTDSELFKRIQEKIAAGVIQITAEGVLIDEAEAGAEPTSAAQPYDAPVWDVNKPQRIGSDRYGNGDRYVSKSTFELARKDPLQQAHEARERWAAIRADKAHPYWNPNDPRHAGAVEEVRALNNAQFYMDGSPVIVDEK